MQKPIFIYKKDRYFFGGGSFWKEQIFLYCVEDTLNAGVLMSCSIKSL